MERKATKIRITKKIEFIIVLIYLCVTWIESCPPSCRCFKSTRLTHCEKKNLNKVPFGIPEYTTGLILSHNNISSIHAHNFNELPHLSELLIANSSLVFFDTEIITKFKNLTVLNLYGNLLTEISKFPSHMNLKSLDLHGNQLKHIDGTTFSLLQNMSILRLGNNQLSTISLDSFKDLKKLTRLNLKNNHFRALKTGIFAGLKELQVLDLRNNYLENLPDIIFGDNQKLELIHLENNYLSELGSNSFSHLNQLKTIRLSMNNLTFIHPNTFTGLNNLRFIYLYGNQIPCSCSFMKLINKPNHAVVLADCFLQKQHSGMISTTDKSLRDLRNVSSMWGNWIEIITCSTPTYLRARLCLDCSTKRHHTRCSHYIRSENSTCVTVDGRGGTFKPLFTSTSQVSMDCEVKCLSTFNIINIISITIGCVLPVIIISLCAYVFMEYRRWLNSNSVTN